MVRLTENDHFTVGGRPTDWRLQDFWRWQASDLLNNTLRGVLAEFIVAKALGIETNSPRTDWGAFDFLFEGCLKIEVKSSAYLQSWTQNGALSDITFSIAPSREWSPERGFAGKQKRHSDLYVFCVFTCQDVDAANPLDLSQWDFYVLPTAVLDVRVGGQLSISLASLSRLDPRKTDYSHLLAVVRSAARQVEAGSALSSR